MFCTYCKYEAPHPSQVPSEWSSKDWDGDKAKAKSKSHLLTSCHLKQKMTGKVMDVTLEKQEMEMTTDLQRLTIQPNEEPTGGH